jgi:phosphomevalonate kinase
MTVVTASAPGKLFLLGEYAVLKGAPALLTAVGRRVRVTAAASDAWRLTAREVGVEALELGEGGALPPGPAPEIRERLALFDAVRMAVTELADTTRSAVGLADDARDAGSGDGKGVGAKVGAGAGAGEPTPLELTIDSSALHEDGHKLGLGSSAAVAAALTAALASARGIRLTREQLFALASSAHRTAQGGSGSGGDVATSVYGGLLLYTRGAPPSPATWPEGLGLFTVVTGTGASTVDLVGRVAAYRERDPLGHDRDLDALRALAAEAMAALADADALLALADEYFRALETLSIHSGAEIVTERHRELREVAAARGAVFKPSGAGGGDLGLVFAKLEATDALQSAFTDLGATVIPTPNSPDGVRIEAT